MKELVFAGAGGQGVLTVGLIVTEIAVRKGMNATWSPVYGSAMRGGTATCTVKYGNGTIYNPTQEEPNLVLAMDQSSFNMYINMVAPGGVMLINSDLVTGDTDIRDDINIVKIPCTSMAQESGNPRGANIIMTGALVKLAEDFSKEEGLNGMNTMFRNQGKEKFEEANTKAFKVGYNYL